MMSVNIPDIDGSQSLAICHCAFFHMKHIARLHIGPDPVLMGLSGKKSLIDKIFPHGITVAPCHDPVGILTGHQP